MSAPVDWLLVGALASETLPLWRRLQGRRPMGPGLWLGRLGRAVVGLQRCGVGPRAATEATQAALERLRPAGLLSLGTAGALAGDWDRGDVLWVGSVSWAEGRPRQLWTGGAPGVGLVTVHAAVWDPERRSELAARGAELVDMEAAAVLDLGERRGVGRLGALKVVSDRAGAERDPVVEGQSRSRLLRLLRFKARALRLCETRLAPALVELLSA